MYVCMYACMHVCMDVWMDGCTCTYVCVCMNVLRNCACCAIYVQCLKESFIKAEGSGLSYGLQKLEFVPGDGWPPPEGVRGLYM